MIRQRKKAQTFVEYSLILGVIVVTILALRPMIMRGGQSMVKTMTDQIANQQSAEQDFSQGYLKEQKEKVATDARRYKGENRGNYFFGYNETTRTTMNMTYNMGYR
ncbi:MAG: hypothetical protein HQL25_03570 [Candidatus Omnitrophica bacterium]|nr:hypothetical protein [Candidatus Omnitrophota bacterium]